MKTKDLQVKLDKMLVQGIEDVKALGIDLYDIIPTVRITDNKRRIGSAQDVNRAFAKVFGTTTIISGKTPLFRISISRRECADDKDIKNVLYHEILHCAPNCQDHQATWKKHATKVNRAYGLNVTTTKNETSTKNEDAGTDDVGKFIGKCFHDGSRTFKFTGFNSRPKNKCDIVDVTTGKEFVCVPSYIARKMDESPALFGASVSSPPHLETSAYEDDMVKRACTLVGKKVKNGPRGRKVFTVVSVDQSKGKKAILLHDEDGREYTGGIGCASKLVVIG